MTSHLLLHRLQYGKYKHCRATSSIKGSHSRSHLSAELRHCQLFSQFLSVHRIRRVFYMCCYKGEENKI